MCKHRSNLQLLIDDNGVLYTFHSVAAGCIPLLPFVGQRCQQPKNEKQLPEAHRAEVKVTRELTDIRNRKYGVHPKGVSRQRPVLPSEISGRRLAGAEMPGARKAGEEAGDNFSLNRLFKPRVWLQGG